MPKKIYLSSGIPVILQKMDKFQSFVLGIWIKHGSRHDPAEKNGLSHFIEHLFFQGTKRRDAKTISYEIDSLGGDINAFTTREFTSIYVKGLKKQISRYLDLLCDLYSNPLFPEQEIEKERSVILDEIRMVNDTPEEFAHDIFMENAFQNSLGLPILGKENTVSNITREDIIDCFKNYYGLGNSLICCAGNFDENELTNFLEKNIKKRKSKPVFFDNPAKFSPGIKVYEKELHEVHLCLGFETVPFRHENRLPLTLLNCIVGGSVSSRLFQEIREKRGLAYNIYSFVSFYSDTGVFGIYTASEYKKINKVIKVIMDILKKLPDNLKEEEIDRAKTQIISQIIYSSESPSSVMQTLAYNEIYLGGVYKVKEQISQIKKIKFEDIRKVAHYLRKDSFNLTVFGPIKKDQLNI
jgi:predicted Zn-dependent peptidase